MGAETGIKIWDGVTPPDFTQCRRIALIGPSSAGKTTLGKALAAHIDAPFVSLDVLHHLPNWQPRPREDFLAEHDRLIAQERWVIEGSYSRTMPQRFARADLILWLDPPIWGCAWRFLCRSLTHYGQVRPDAPEGCAERLSLDMYHYTLIDYPKRRRSNYLQLLRPHAKKAQRIAYFRDVKKLHRLVG